MKQFLTYRVIIEPDDDAYHAYVPALQGCHTWGESVEEAREMIRDAIGVYVRSCADDDVAVPQDVGVEVLETIATPVGAHM